jgi:hypothetical protein
VFNLCELLRRRGKEAEARSLLQETVDAARRRFGPAHHLVADVLAAQASQTSDRSEREQLYREALAIYDKSPGPPRRKHVACLNLLAVCIGPSRPAEAEQLLQRALPLACKQLGKRHAFVATLLLNRARYSLEQGKSKGIEAELREAAVIARENPGSFENLRLLRKSEGLFYAKTGDAAKAVAAALERRKLAGNDPSELYDVARELASHAALPSAAARSGEFQNLAMETLRQARRRGFTDLRRLQMESEFGILRQRPDFQALLSELQKAGK